MIYKRKEEEGNIPEHADIPEYWKDEIAKQNEEALKEREKYEIEKNKLEILLQPQVLFNIIPNESVQYLDLKDTEEQGVKIKFTFDTTVGEVKEMVRKELNFEAFQNFGAFETCQLANNMNQVYRSFSDCDDSMKIKDTKITHLSTWLVTTDETIISYLESVKGEEKEPIFINLRNQDEEQRTIFYRDMF